MDNGSPHDLMSKNLPDNCVKYYLFIVDDIINNYEQLEILQEVCRAAKQLTNSLLGGYIWQREGFSVNPVELAGRNALSGETSFGDSIEDEWVVTFLLRELSLSFPSLWIRLEDTDGEFLLIEAGNALPRWLNPDVAENRVWINRGRLLLIPPECPKGLKPLLGGLSLQAALEQLAARQSMLLHLPTLESEAFRRLQKYPNDISKNNHRALVLVPRKVAYIIYHRPTYICLAADAFHIRDPISIKALRPPQHTGLTFGPTDLVEVLVKFTRVSFAQLKSQHFPMMQNWAQQLPNNATIEDIDRLELGMKVACGFEMLIHETQSRAVNAVSDIMELLQTFRNTTDSLLPDQEIQSWGKTEDSDSWLDIDYNDFEHDLDNEPLDASLNREDADKGQGQNDLRKLIVRFKSLVDEDSSDESNTSASSNSDDLASVDEDSGVNEIEGSALEKTTDHISFDEARFTNIMRGWSSDLSNIRRETLLNTAMTQGPGLAGDSEVDAHDNDEEIETFSKAMESELLQLGALQNTGSKDSRTISLTKAVGLDESRCNLANQESHDEEAMEDTDLNLATNILQSFRSQAGLAGPGGNLMSLLGIRPPRDDDSSSGAHALANSSNIPVVEWHKQ